MKTVRIIIEGEKVHGVGYRPFLLRAARENAIKFFDARNVEDEALPQVIVSASGSVKQISNFTEYIRKNQPKQAKTHRIRVDPKPPLRVMSINDYEKILSAEQQDKIIQAGLGMRDKQDETIKVLGGKMDSGNKMLGEKIDSGNRMLAGKIDSLGDKIESGNKNTLGKIDELITKTDSFHNDTNTRFDTLDNKYGLISQNMERLMTRMDKSIEGADKTFEVLVAQQKNFNSALNNLSTALLKLAEKK